MGIQKGDKVLKFVDLLPGRQIQKVQRGQKQFWLIEGQEQPAFEEVGQAKITREAFFYSAKEGDRSCWVINGKPGPFFDQQVWDEEPQFRDGRVFYRVKIDRKQHVFLDGELSPGYDETWGPSFSEGHIDYVVRDGKAQFLILDGQRLGPYDKVYNAHREDGHVYYQAERDGQSFLVLDGAETPSYDEIYGSGAKERVFWYQARTGKKWFYVVNEQQGPCFDTVDTLSDFDVSGGRYAYSCQRVDTQMVVSDTFVFETPGKIKQVEICRGKVVFVVNEGDKSCLFVDNVPVAEVFTPDSIWFEEKNGVLYYGGKVRHQLTLEHKDSR